MRGALCMDSLGRYLDVLFASVSRKSALLAIPLGRPVTINKPSRRLRPRVGCRTWLTKRTTYCRKVQSPEESEATWTRSVSVKEIPPFKLLPEPQNDEAATSNDSNGRLPRSEDVTSWVERRISCKVPSIHPAHVGSR
jgi:hypothetical protein